MEKKIEVMSKRPEHKVWQSSQNHAKKRKEKKRRAEPFDGRIRRLCIFIIEKNDSLIAGNKRWNVIIGKDPVHELLCHMHRA